MPIMFNQVLRGAMIDPAATRLLRHQDNRTDPGRTPYLLWRNRPDDFLTYQSRQSIRRSRLFGTARHWAVFVRTPSNEDLFAGLYEVGESRPGDPEEASVSKPGTREGPGYLVYALTESDRLREYVGKLAIGWGSAALAWAQYAHKHDKPVVALHAAHVDPPFPHYLRFNAKLSDVPGLHQTWADQLRRARGVYVLTSLTSDGLYVGSADGEGGFFDRWCEHAARRGDAVWFRAREPQDYQVAILEVAGSSATREDILNAEQSWMARLRANVAPAG